jgi:phosphoglycerate dehydrogenase-like enzyme
MSSSASSSREEEEEKKDAIPVTVFTNHKLMDSKPIERLREMTFERLKIECVSDAEGEKRGILLGDEREKKGHAAPTAAVGWWFADTASLCKYIEENDECKKYDIVWTHSASAGVDHLLKHEAIRTHGSAMTNAKGAFSASLGEWAIFASMYFAKEVFNMQRAQREKVWKRFQVDMLKGKEMLVVGYGDIGRSIGKRAKAMGMNVKGVRSKKVIEERDREVVSEMFTLQELEKAVETADYVALALPHTKETENVVDEKVFGKMKTSAVLINVGRGASVDENALCDALNTGKIRGAALDVFQTEPLPESSQLWSIDESKLLMSFHSADLTSDYHDLAMDVFVENLKRFDQSGGKTDDLINKVDKTVGY